MKINSLNPLSSGQIRPEVAGASPVAKIEESSASQAQLAPTLGKSDAVQISAAGRALAARSSSADALTPERTAEIRQRVLHGAYNALSVVDIVARRLAASGDLK